VAIAIVREKTIIALFAARRKTLTQALAACTIGFASKPERNFWLPKMPKRILLTQWKVEPKTCTCETCQGMCDVPCWPSPEEAKRLIKLGYGPKLMVCERLCLKKEEGVKYRYISVLSPAKEGREGKDNKEVDEGCTFQVKGLCQLHTICKPLEGRLATCKGREPVDLRDRVAELWDNAEAQQILEEWVQVYGEGENEDWERFDGGMGYFGDDDYYDD